MKNKKTLNDLNLAIRTQDIDRVKELIDSGILPDSTSLSFGVQYKNLPILRLLVEAGATPSYKNIFYAVKSGNKDIVDILSNYKIKIPKNNDLLIQAIFTKNKYIIKKILDLGVKPNKDDLDLAIFIGNDEIVDLLNNY